MRFLEECLSAAELAGVSAADVAGFAVTCDEAEDLVVLLAIRDPEKKTPPQRRCASGEATEGTE